ncbi:MAG TPA: sodium/solute symporter [Tepidisphaeraceae bacterium]|nr:sodium/solute symporter [Tepidisphaeraceae bacterium]
MAHSLSLSDYVVIAIYLIGSLAFGLQFAFRQKSVEKYFLADRTAKWWAVGISLIAANLSAVSYLGEPAWLMQHDLQVDMYSLFMPLALPLVAYGFFPFLVRLRVISIYEYLEHRFSLSVRAAGSALFQLLRGGHLAAAVYIQGLMVCEFVRLPFWACVVMIGFVTGVYTVFGGMEAVLWTDVIQFFVLVGGLIASISAVMVSTHGSVAAIWHAAAVGGHTRMFNFHFSLTGINFWAVIISLVFINTIATYGSDQLMVQRLLTAGSEKKMRRSLYFGGLLNLCICVLLVLYGLSLVGYYQRTPSLKASLPKIDDVVPHFVSHVLPHGVAGLVIASVFAATMSSLSAGLNSLSTTSIIDFYRRFQKRKREAKTEMRAARIATLTWATLITVTALFIGKLGTIVQIVLILTGWFTGPILGMFMLGILSRRANTMGVLTGAIVGSVATGCISATSLHWIWYAPFGCGVTLMVGLAASCLPMARQTSSHSQGLTIYDIGRTLPDRAIVRDLPSNLVVEQSSSIS